MPCPWIDCDECDLVYDYILKAYIFVCECDHCLNEWRKENA